MKSLDEKEEKEKTALTTEEIQEKIIYFAGPVVTFRALKQGVRKCRGLLKTEFTSAIQHLKDVLEVGNIVDIRMPKQAELTKVFIKKSPEEVGNNASVDVEKYRTKFKMRCHTAITLNMRTKLVAEGHVMDNLFQ